MKDKIITYGSVKIEVKGSEELIKNSEGILLSLFDVFMEDLDVFLKKQEKVTKHFTFVVEEVY